MELTLGPVLFEWKREELLRFYEEVCGMDFDRVYVGEVVCTKKLAPGLDDIAAIRDMLVKAGKKVTLSSLAVVSNEEELEFTRRLVSAHDSIEANDMSVLNMADASSKEVCAGAHITSYNSPSVEFLKGIGVKRVIYPVELSRESISHINSETGVFGEAFAHGKLPLAFSWRCYTSRAYGLNKTECRHHCAKFPDGMELKTLDKEPLFTVNGTSILSARTYSLIEFVDDLKEIGVKALRISPQHADTAKVAAIFRKRIDGRLGAGEALEGLKKMAPALCNGWYCGGAGKDYMERLEA